MVKGAVGEKKKKKREDEGEGEEKKKQGEYGRHGVCRRELMY